MFQRIPEWFRIIKDEENIYIPTLQFNNADTIQRVRKSGTTNKDSLWFQQPNSVEYSQVLKATIYCTFNFESFPFDTHYCDLTFFTIDDSVKVA